MVTRSELPCCVGERMLIVEDKPLCHQLTAGQRAPPPQTLLPKGG